MNKMFVNRLLLSLALAVLACGGVSAMDFVDLQKPTMVQIDGTPAGEAVGVGGRRLDPGEARRPLSRVTLTWNVNLGAGTKVLGGEWERTYGDSEWHRLDQPEEERPRKGAMPWYFLATDGSRTDGYGVETQPIGEPLDWLETLRPTRWQCGDEIRTFHWE